MNLVSKLGVALFAASALIASTQALAQEKLTVWWVRGFYKSEDDALFAAIKKYEDKTGVKVDLSQYPVQDMIPKTVAALDAGTPPDVAYADVYDFQVTGKWAFDGKLEDISDIITPIKDKFLKNTIETTYLYNDKTKKKAYYAFPLKQQTMHIQYWKDMLGEAGFKESDIPTQWKAYWDFWCDKVQPAHRTQDRQAHVRDRPADGCRFERLVLFVPDVHGRLQREARRRQRQAPRRRSQGAPGPDQRASRLHDRSARAAARRLRRRRGRTPTTTSRSHNKTILLTHNATISIAAKWLDDANNATLSAEQRAQAKKNYDELIATAGFPNKPDGSKFVYRAAVKTGVIFEASKNKRRAKEFVTFMMQDENLQPYVEGSLGRWFPVTISGTKSAFWQADPHRKAVFNQFGAGTVTFEFTKNYKFTVLNNENVWAKAMSRVVNDNVSVEKATDEMIARIKQVAG